MGKLTLVILLLVFALFIQNTCPFGAAGKSSALPTCEHCPFHHARQLTAQEDGLKKLVSDPSPIHFPLYVFALAKTVHTFQPGQVPCAPPLFAKDYQDALSHGLLRPPQG